MSRLTITRAAERSGRSPGGRGRPGVADFLLAALLAYFSISNPPSASRFSGSATVAVFYGITAVCCTAIALRRLHPVASVCAIGAALTGHLVVSDEVSLLSIVSCMIAAETTQSRMRRPWSLVLLALVYVGVVPAACRAGAIIDPQVAGDFVNRMLIPNVTGWALVSVAALIGAARRRARERVEQALERAAILQAQQDTERRLAVAQERQRIARDVHDLLGHSLSVTGMQAAGARAVLASDPDAADAALAVIGETSRRAADEVRALVDVLRADEDRAPAGSDADAPAARPGAAPSQPPRPHSRPVPVPACEPADSPGLEEVPALVARARRAGLPVRLSLSQAGDVDPAVGRAVYRCVQEALTNIMRHASGAPTAVALEAGEVLDVVVENTDAGAPGGARRPAGCQEPVGSRREGAGLATMAERLADVGGHLEAGPAPAGGWRVRMTVPASRDAARERAVGMSRGVA
ncbi:histidine kinase [Actinomyces israelii]|uniref:histidine kinase n=1 Tax=Actinomyces israelii TaxID=1659 RepID=A0ABT4I6T8_9ACTO|nr:histidine kinase [Actinomyces israelii]MCZ0857440.1 histidine kinase [Actinomyces israelii]